MPASGISPTLTSHQMDRVQNLFVSGISSERGAHQMPQSADPASIPSSSSIELRPVQDSLALYWRLVDQKVILLVLKTHARDSQVHGLRQQPEMISGSVRGAMSQLQCPPQLRRRRKKARPDWRGTARTSSSWQQSRNRQYSGQGCGRSRTKEPPDVRMLKTTRDRGGSTYWRE